MIASMSSPCTVSAATRFGRAKPQTTHRWTSPGKCQPGQGASDTANTAGGFMTISFNSAGSNRCLPALAAGQLDGLRSLRS
jgi:hypothetical protein